jgi:hypothetical protein
MESSRTVRNCVGSAARCKPQRVRLPCSPRRCRLTVRTGAFQTPRRGSTPRSATMPRWSKWLRRLPLKQETTGSSPVRGTIPVGPSGRWRRTVNPHVAGSNPATGAGPVSERLRSASAKRRKRVQLPSGPLSCGGSPTVKMRACHVRDRGSIPRHHTALRR